VETSRKKPSREDLEAFETSYNAACGCIARGELGCWECVAEETRDLCEALDELSDEEKRAEVLPIMVQQAFVFTKLGKLEEAEALQKMINIAEYVEEIPKGDLLILHEYSVPEPPSRVIAQNNALAGTESRCVGHETVSYQSPANALFCAMTRDGGSGTLYSCKY